MATTPKQIKFKGALYVLAGGSKYHLIITVEPKIYNGGNESALIAVCSKVYKALGSEPNSGSARFLALLAPFDDRDAAKAASDKVKKACGSSVTLKLKKVGS